MSDFDKYIRQGEPGQAEKARIWQAAIGLQDVDGLKTSDYLLETAKEHIEGKIDIAAVQQQHAVRLADVQAKQLNGSIGAF